MAGGWSAILFITNRLRETTTTTTWHQQARLCFASSNLWSIVILVAFNLPPNGSSGPGIPSQWEFLSIGAFVMLLDVMLLLSLEYYLLVDVPSTDQNTTVIATGYVLFCYGGVDRGGQHHHHLIHIIIRI